MTLREFLEDVGPGAEELPVKFFDGAHAWEISAYRATHRTGDRVLIESSRPTRAAVPSTVETAAFDMLRELEAIEAALCAEWLRADGSGKHMAVLLDRASTRIIAAGGDSLWPRIEKQYGTGQREITRPTQPAAGTTEPATGETGSCALKIKSAPEIEL